MNCRIPELCKKHHDIVRACGASIIFLAIAIIGSLFWFEACGSFLFLVLASVGSLLAAAIIFFHFSKILSTRTSQTFVYVSCLTLLGLTFVFAFPPFSVPDEMHHFSASYWLSNIVLGEGDGLNSDPLPMRKVDYDLCSTFSDVGKVDESLYSIGGGTYHAIAENFDLLNTDSGATSEARGYSFSVGSENVVSKVGSVVGITLARLLNLGALPLFYIGRIGSLIVYIVCMVLAFRVMPVAKPAVILTSLLPMSLHLAASYSYDSGIISLTVLLVSFIARGIFEEQQITGGTLFCIAFLAALVAPCKIVYSVALILVLFIPSRKFSSRSVGLAFKVGVFVVGAISLLLFRAASVTDMAASSPAFDIRGDEVGHYYDLDVLLSNPSMTAKLFVQTLDTYGSYYLFTMIGGSLGWLQENLEMPWLFMLLYVVVGLYAMQSSDSDPHPFSGVFRISCTVLFFVSMLGSMLSMCLGHTFTTEHVIRGVQGRYLLPVLPMLLFACRSSRVSVGRSDSISVAISAYACLNILYLIRFVGLALTLP